MVYLIEKKYSFISRWLTSYEKRIMNTKINFVYGMMMERKGVTHKSWNLKKFSLRSLAYTTKQYNFCLNYFIYLSLLLRYFIKKKNFRFFSRDNFLKPNSFKTKLWDKNIELYYILHLYPKFQNYEFPGCLSFLINKQIKQSKLLLLRKQNNIVKI